MLVNGEWRPDAFEATNGDGEFDRQTTTFRDRIGDDEDVEYPVETDRYHLYICRACPWAHRDDAVDEKSHRRDRPVAGRTDPARRRLGVLGQNL